MKRRDNKTTRRCTGCLATLSVSSFLKLKPG